MKLITKQQFEKKVIFLSEIMVETILLEIGNGLRPVTQCEQKWFIEHVDYRLRYFYSTQEKWKKKLRSEGGRDYAWMFIKHWAEAFIKDIKRYMRHHPVEMIHEVIKIEKAVQL